MPSPESAKNAVSNDATLLELYGQLNGLFTMSPYVEGDDGHHYNLPILMPATQEICTVGIDDCANLFVDYERGRVTRATPMMLRHHRYRALARKQGSNFQFVSQDSTGSVSLIMARPGSLADRTSVRLSLSSYLLPNEDPNILVCVDYVANGRVFKVSSDTVLGAIAKAFRARKGEWETQTRF